jgi:hypothetical protein
MLAVDEDTFELYKEKKIYLLKFLQKCKVRVIDLGVS